MGYDLSIIRYKGEEPAEIAFEEWKNYVDGDEELEQSDMTDDGMYWEWNAHPEHNDPAAGRPWLNYSNGQIYSKNPDREMVIKMVQIASTLDAKVQGQDGEFYDADGVVDEVQDKEEPGKKFLPVSKPWWRFW